MERQPEIWARPAACTSSQQQYKHLPKNWPQPCLRDEVKGEVCADISWGCSFHPRDYLCPQDHRCHPVGESRAKSAHAVWKLRCRESSSRQNKAKSGDRASRELLLCSQGVGGLQALGPQLGLFPVSSPPPGQIWAPAGLLQQSPGQASDISHCSVTPEGLSGPAQASTGQGGNRCANAHTDLQESETLFLLCSCYFSTMFSLIAGQWELSVCGQKLGRCFL